MVAKGRVQNGVVMLVDGVCLPEGQDVVVVSPPLESTPTHSIMDIPGVSLGYVVTPIGRDVDLLGEMLESRP